MNKQTNQSHANGIDSLSLTLILAAVVFLLLGKLAVFFFFLAALCLALGIWRGASRNLAARQAERSVNQRFLLRGMTLGQPGCGRCRQRTPSAALLSR